MKVFAVIALLAVIAYAAADEAAKEPKQQAPPPKVADYVGDLITPSGEKLTFGSPLEDAHLANLQFFSIPSCSFGFEIGTPICLAKCISEGHYGGLCVGSSCKCIG